MKKLVITFLTALMLVNAPALPRAEASAGIYWYYCGGGPGTDYDGWGCLRWLFVGAPLGVAGVVTTFFYAPVGVPLMLLDEDNQQNFFKLEKVMGDQFSFIEDKDVIKNLSLSLGEKLNQAPIVQTQDVNGLAMNVKIVSISENEIRNILRPADLNEKQIQTVIDKLQ